ncbi:ankyrin repeat-containing domain protein [Neocallimastix lanati (nom. inval.)]|nr:ankyrin repeat-containing domain protein [Neocallimastix sp. JGI-2020a]
MSKINDATLLYKVNLNSEYDENDNDDKLPLINNKQDTVIDENKQIEVTALNEKLNEKKNEDVSSSTQGLSVPLSLNSSVLLNNKIESSVSGIDAVINENIPIVSYATSSNGNINNKGIDGISTWENIDINNTKNSEMEIDWTLHQASQRGLFEVVKNLILSNKAGSNDKDEQNCTALHWAAINNHLEIAKFLLIHGARVDEKGGDLLATPLHWAARSGHLQMVTLLYRHHANPNIIDNQGYNALHLAIHGGYPMLALYLISLGMEVDALDPMERTPLMWAAYLGNSLECARVLIRMGADVNLVDKTKFTALHWAITSRHMDIAKVIIEAGARYDIKDEHGKTAFDWIENKGTKERYDKIVEDYKLSLEYKPGSKKDTRNKIIGYLLPFILYPTFLILIGKFYWFISVPIILVIFYGLSLIIKKVLSKGGRDKMESNPFVASLYQSTLFYLFLNYIFVFFKTHSYFLCLFHDPGNIPHLSIESRNKVIQELAEQDILDSRHYCVECNIRKPIRSKHCRFCNKCVILFDHHCPWTYNCIGYLNHRSFVIFLYSTVIGGILLFYIAINYFKNLPIVKGSPFCLFSERMCSILAQDSYSYANCSWLLINLCWCGFLAMIQTYQIARAYTTNESANYYKYDYLTRKEDVHLQYYKRRYYNPFDFGVIRNTIYFWRRSGYNKNINWYTIYDVPEDLNLQVIGGHEVADDNNENIEMKDIV